MARAAQLVTPFRGTWSAHQLLTPIRSPRGFPRSQLNQAYATRINRYDVLSDCVDVHTVRPPPSPPFANHA